MIERLDETIVAISSAAGTAPVGIVRLSGPRATEIADQLARLSDDGLVSEQSSWTFHSAEVAVADAITVPSRLLVFRAPKSYTRQDLVEIHTVGSPVILEMVRKRAISFGAIAAQPGEFTARAFLNGGMDLSSAEAVAGVIRAQTDSQLRASRRQLDGMLSKRISEARDALAELLALVEADIDFAEEPIEFITPPELKTRLGDVRDQLMELDRGAISAERLDSLPRILLLGPPNAGKSSLMNRLSGTNRAICAAVAGTTRDVLSAPIRFGAGEAILLDSAGVDESEDEIIARARAMTLSAAERVDLVCLVVDATSGVDRSFVAKVRSLHLPPVIVAANKCDLLRTSSHSRSLDWTKGERGGSQEGKCEGVSSNAHVNTSLDEVEAHWQDMGFANVLSVSALCGDGIDELRAAMANLLASGLTTASAEGVVLNERQRTAIRGGCEAIARAAELASTATETVDCADVLAFELRDVLDLLGEITGEVTTEDLLSQVFARFCIGK